MSIFRICMQRWEILALLVAISIGISVAANGGVSIQNTSSNVGTDNTSNVSILGINYTTADQWVEIGNNGSSNVSLTGWKLMNQENLSYNFPTDFILKAGDFVRVHSAAGKNNSTDLYNSSVLLSQNGDTPILKNPAGMITSKYTYPATIAGAPKPTTNATKSNVTTPKTAVYKTNNTKTTVSNIATNTAKDITKVTIVK